MPEIVIQGIPIRFPFEPYDLQRDYMTKVIECLQSSSNGALESPTGTGKTLCLLCATLGWLEYKKASIQADYAAAAKQGYGPAPAGDVGAAAGGFTPAVGDAGAGWGAVGGNPRIIYSSRTHAQLSQAIGELKRTSYNYMKVSVLGSRDQLCIHPEVSKELNNNTKQHMCQLRVKSKTCYFYNQVEGKKDDPFLKTNVLDLEDLVKYGRRRTCCPYYLARDLRQEADIIFMPYNYLLDPRIRKAHGIELRGYVVILDEAHNIEKICEESASLQLRSTDIAMCIEEVTQVMQKLTENGGEMEAFAAANDPASEAPQDFSVEDLYILKTLFLQFEQAVDAIPVSTEGQSYPGSFMFDLLEKAEIVPSKKPVICDLLDKLVQYLTSSSSSPFQRKGAGLQKFSDLIKIVFSKDNFTLEHMNAIKKSYRVHVAVEDPRKRGGWGGGAGAKQGENNGGGTWGDKKGAGGGWGDKGGSWGNKGGWGDKGGGWGNKGGGWGENKGSGTGKEQSNTLTSKQGRVLSYWCFNPGFGMKELVEQGLRSLIITSGTLSPLQSFTQELQVGFPVQLENPHIIQGHQVMVAVVSKGPDGQLLNSSYQNRSRPQYINSLGQLILNFSKVVPGGLLVFFPSYPIMRNCHEHWQNRGIWDKITNIKAAFVEPQGKNGFMDMMHEFYEKVNDPALRGAIFMAVCRGKVSEGLDFADGNGRAVIITGLPYPPFKDPRVVLKQQYLDTTLSQEKRGMSGQAWYRLEASRAVNQAIGRVIRHKDDYGAILLADHRFGSSGFASQLSKWVQPHLKVYTDFGPTMRDLTRFFRTALTTLPLPSSKRKQGSGMPAISATYDPLPSSPVTSSAFSRAPSRLVLRNTENNLSSALHASDRKLLGSYGFSSPNSNVSVSRIEAKDDVINSADGFIGLENRNIKIERDSSSGSKDSMNRNGAGSGRINEASMGLLDRLQADEVKGGKYEHSSKCGVLESVAEQSNVINFNNLKRPRNDSNASSVVDFNTINFSNKSSLSSKSKYEDLTSFMKRRKIKVTANASSNNCDQNTAASDSIENKDAETEVSVRTANTSNKKASADNIKKTAVYIKEVKSCLEPEEYKEFSSACRLYQSKRDYPAVLAVLLRIFSHQNRHHLFKKFSAFLTAEHRKDFAAKSKAMENSAQNGT